ncbi:hypothetical protein IWQ60_001557 [Tieghemiomyces parasiticus]|uniref:Uncharacterized protein n=1 Tax=Tieghemiomyces parasiticus TaxID=78921 RepID=A0A9W8AKI8_9FUNG|nr:hypothetical protein IWQ60_001557 [Tieghemiomyces parasiticus]
MEERLKLWREQKSGQTKLTSGRTADKKPMAAAVSKIGRPTLQPKNQTARPMPGNPVMGKPADKVTKPADTSAMTKRITELNHTVQHQQTRIQGLEAELQRLTDTLVPRADLEDLAAAHSQLQAEFADTNDLLAECRLALEATLGDPAEDADTPTAAELQAVITEQAQRIEDLESQLLQASWQPITGESLVAPELGSRKRGYDELQSALEETIEENERLYKRVATLESYLQTTSGAGDALADEVRDVRLTDSFISDPFQRPVSAASVASDASQTTVSPTLLLPPDSARNEIETFKKQLERIRAQAGIGSKPASPSIP